MFTANDVAYSKLNDIKSTRNVWIFLAFFLVTDNSFGIDTKLGEPLENFVRARYNTGLIPN